MSSLFAVPAGRLAKWLGGPARLVVVVAVIAGNLPGKFSDAEKNESTSFLPGDAESTKALAITKQLQGGEQAATVIAYRRPGGLTAADKQTIAADNEKLNALQFPGTTAFARPQLSRDGSTALVVNTIKGNGEGSRILDPVEKYRDLVSGDRDGLEVKVTGPAGFSADAIKVFEGINGTLLAAAGLLVLILLVIIYRSPFFWFFPLLAVIFGEVASRGLGYVVTQL